MKWLPHLLCFALATTVSLAQTQTPDTDTSDTETPPAGATVITSDELEMDQVGHTAVFTGNVVVNGNAFNMKCEEMTVYFTNASKVDNIVAKGNVVIVQPGRITHCGQAQYFHDDDKFVLTDQPYIIDNQNKIEAPEITIFRTKKSLFTKGRTKTTIIQSVGSSANPDPTASDAK